MRERAEGKRETLQRTPHWAWSLTQGSIPQTWDLDLAWNQELSAYPTEPPGAPNLHPVKCTNSQWTVSFDEVHSHVTTTTRRARPFSSHQEPGYLEVGGELQDHPSPRPFLLRMGSRDPGQDSDLLKLTAQSVGFVSSTSLTSPRSLRLLSGSQFLQDYVSPNHVLGPPLHPFL